MQKNIIKFTSIIIFLYAICNWNLSAQSTGCNQVLEQAKAVYLQGNIEQIPEILGDCPIRKSLSPAKKEEALVLITETYIYMKEMEKADSTFLLLLKINPSFKLDSFSLSPELDRLSRTFRTHPIFSIGIKAGTNLTFVKTLQSFSTDNNINPINNAQHFVAPGYRGGFEIDYAIGKYIEISTGVDYAMRNYLYKDSLIHSGIDDFESYGTLEFKENQSWLEVPLLARLVWHPKNQVHDDDTKFKTKIHPYFYIGGRINLLMQSQFGYIQRSYGATDVRENSLPIYQLNKPETNLRANKNFSATIGIGAKYRIGLNYLTFDLQYNHLFDNVVSRKNRYTNDDFLYKYAYVDNDFKVSDLSFSIGFSKTIYKPKKKQKSPYQYTITKEETEIIDQAPAVVPENEDATEEESIIKETNPSEDTTPDEKKPIIEEEKPQAEEEKVIQETPALKAPPLEQPRKTKPAKIKQPKITKEAVQAEEVQAVEKTVQEQTTPEIEPVKEAAETLENEAEVPYRSKKQIKAAKKWEEKSKVIKSDKPPK